uniref:Uncharacterized protein n=1 Tax=Anopheles dirus TaxID=7168 RepID=A0A182NA55_9DIPT
MMLCDRILFSSATANFCPMQFRGPALNGTYCFHVEALRIELFRVGKIVRVASEEERQHDHCMSFSIVMVTGCLRSSPTMLRTSLNARCCTSGFFARLSSMKLIADVVVSWPSNMNVSTSSRISRSVSGRPSTLDWSSMSKNAMRFFMPTESSWSSLPVAKPSFSS